MKIRSVNFIISFLFLAAVFVPLSVAGAQTDSECMDCHEDTELIAYTALGDTVSAFFDVSVYYPSAHYQAGFACIDCHVDIEEIPHEDDLMPVDCNNCHIEVAEEYLESLHGYALERGNENAPGCSNCHGKHNIFPSSDNRSLTHHLQLPQTCGVCHNEYGLKIDPEIRIARAVEIYLGSVHGRNLAKGIAAAATCNDCHGTHNLKGAANIESTVNHQNIPVTCSKCHGDIYYQYSNSIHGKALSAGITDAPVCTDCHGEHSIKSTVNPESPTFPMSLSEQICADCHEDVRIIEKYGLPTGTLKTYQDSYHGLATQKGSGKAATCVSCHNSHYILSAMNLNSTIHPDNVAETCRTCHPNADNRFAVSYTHSSQRGETNPIDRYVRAFYILAIVVIIGFMIVHNMIIMAKYIREKYRFDEHLPTIVRFDKHIITQHISLTVSFIVLAVTGFALRFPEAWWVDVLTFLGLSEPARSLLH
ncbi:cytochrome c3 family protein, partial [candidate division KSB1 bacterium]